MVLFHPRALVSKQMLPQGVTKGKERSMGFAQGHTGLLRPSPGPFSPDLEGIEAGKESSREPRKTWGPCSAVMSQVASRARGSEREAVPGNFSGRSGLGCLPLGADLAGRAVIPHTIPFTVWLCCPRCLHAFSNFQWKPLHNWSEEEARPCPLRF